jgi:hypothetical protein
MDNSKIVPEFYFEDVYRYVKTYSFSYHTHTKARWIKRNILEVFSTEFKAYDAEYYVKQQASDNSRKMLLPREESKSTGSQ